MTETSPRALEPEEEGRALRAAADKLRSAVMGARAVLLTGPMDPDGDSIGACLGLARGIRALGVPVVHVAGRPSFRYTWMPGAEAMIPDDEIVALPEGPDGTAAPYDLAIVLDGDRRRLEAPVEAAFLAAEARGIIDHHGSTEPDGYDIVLLDRAAASTCELVHGVLERWGHPLDPDLATLFYAGLIFDTGGFRHSNTTPETHRLAARLLAIGIDHACIAVRILMERRPNGLRLMGHVLNNAEFVHDGRIAMASVSEQDMQRLGVRSGDMEGIVDALLYTRGVELACLFIEREARRVKLSLRSRKDVDVARLAAELAPGGGGHARAAGVLLEEDLDDVLDRVPRALCEALGGHPE